MYIVGVNEISEIKEKGNKLNYSLKLPSGGNHLTVVNEVIQIGIFTR